MIVRRVRFVCEALPVVLRVGEDEIHSLGQMASPWQLVRLLQVAEIEGV